MKKSLIIFFVILIITSAYAQVQITDPSRQTDRVINLQIPGPPIFNNATANVNSSEFAHIWITNEGNMDNIPDLYPTLDTRFCRFEDCVNISGDTMTGDLILNDDVRLLLGTSGAEGQIFSDGTDFRIESFANKNLNIKVNDFLTGLSGSNLSILGSDHIGGLDADGGLVIIRAGDGGFAGEAGFGGFIWLKGGIGTIQNRGVHIKDTFSATPGGDATNSLYVEGVFHTDSRSVLEKGMVCNDLGGGLTTDDCVWESNTESLALFLDASIDHLFINVPSNFTDNATFVEDVTILGTLFGGSPVKIAGINVTSGNLIVDTDTLFVDSTLNRVGIGNSAPTVDLDVTGIIRASTSVNSAVFAEHGSASNANIAMSSSDTMTFDTGGLQAMHIDASQNVIVGDTTTADGLLNVFAGSAGTVSARAAGDDFVIEGSGNTGMSILTPDTSTSTIIFGSPSDPLGADIKWNHDNDVFIIGSRKTNATLRFVSGGGVTALNINKNQNFDFQDGNLVTGGDLNLMGDFNWADYLSITTTTDSDKSSGEQNIFDEDNYFTGFTFVNNSDPKGIKFTASTGQFTINQTGIYTFTINMVLGVPSTTQVTYIIKEDGSVIYSHSVGIHPSVDPALTGLTQVRKLTAGSNLTFHIDPTTSTFTAGADDGTTFSIWRIS